MVTFGQKQHPPLPQDATWLLSPAERAAATPAEMLCQFEACVVGKTQEAVMVAAIDPSNLALREYVKQHIGPSIEWYTACARTISHTMRSQGVDFQHEIAQLVGSKNALDTTIPKVVTYIIQYAFQERASDIHIEPRRHNATLRFRLDGVLHLMSTLPMEVYPALVARIKILSNLRTDETRRPQDGRIELEAFEGSSLRVSVMPTLHGEKIVMRILDESSTVLEPSTLGFSQAQSDIIRRNIEKPFGMIVASGPTGSGKTTSLYALLQLLKKDDVNIATLEDPIEYSLPQVNQTQIHQDLGLSFAQGLRSLLRQDPDVILVGEIRDHETIAMAANAAMTGHLVLTSMHTNDAASAFSRFMEMGVEDFMVASIVNLVIAQRLVRKVCDHCRVSAPLDAIVVEKAHERADIIDALEAHQKGLTKKLASHEFTHGEGCEHCLGTGFTGRVGIFELLETNKEIHDLILAHAPTHQIQAAAKRSGSISMLDDGIAKVMDGTTTLAEVMRTTRTS